MKHLMERIADTDIFYSLRVLLFAVSVIHHSSGVADSGGARGCGGASWGRGEGGRSLGGIVGRLRRTVGISRGR